MIEAFGDAKEMVGRVKKTPSELTQEALHMEGWRIWVC